MSDSKKAASPLNLADFSVGCQNVLVASPKPACFGNTLAIALGFLTYREL